MTKYVILIVYSIDIDVNLLYCVKDKIYTKNREVTIELVFLGTVLFVLHRRII